MSLVIQLRNLRHGPLRGLGPVWLLLGRGYRAALRHLPGSGTTEQWIGPYGPFRMDAEFAFSDFKHWGRGHNRGFQACIEAGRGKSCVFDIGAHIGLVTLPMSRAVASGGRVYAFEPADANRRHLEQHLAKNRITNVEVIDALAGAEPEGEVTFYEQSQATGINSVAIMGAREDFHATRRRQVSLDAFCQERRLAPDLLKIDVEGGEVDVLRGARQIIAQHHPEIFLSVHPSHLTALGHSESELAQLIADLGYDCLDMDDQAVTRLRLDEYHLVPKARDHAGSL